MAVSGYLQITDFFATPESGTYGVVNILFDERKGALILLTLYSWEAANTG